MISNSVCSQSSSTKDSLLSVIRSTDQVNVKFDAYSVLVKLKSEHIGESQRFIEEAIQYAQEKNSDYHLALFQIYLAELFVKEGNYSEGLENLQNAVSIGNEINSDSILSHAYIDIAIIYFYWNNYEKAEEFATLSLDNSNSAEISDYYSVIYNLLGAIYGETNEPIKAKIYMKKYLKYGIESNTSRYIISAYNNLALISIDIGDLDSSLIYSRLALNLALKINDFDGQHKICNSLVRIFLHLNELDSAHYYLQKELLLKNNSNSTMRILYTYKYAYQYFKQANVIDSALYFHEVYVGYKDSLFSREQYDKISELQTRLETEKHQVIIKNLESKNKINMLMMYGISVVLVLIIIIGWLVYRSYRLKNNLMLQNQSLLEEKSSTLKTKVKFQQREMFNNAIYIINQNKVYDGIIKDLKSVSKLPKEEQHTAFTLLIQKIQKNKQGSEQKEFEIKFKKLHENFYKKIKEKFPQLTKKDLDLCAFLNLNMSTKEIAGLTNQSTRAIEVSRSRLRKKMEIDGGINLSEFIRNIRL